MFNKYLHLFCAIFLLTAIQNNLRAQEMPVKVGKVLDLCYEFKLKSADSLLGIYFKEKKSGEDFDLNMLQANIYWWKIITGINNEKIMEAYYKNLATAENFFQLEEINSNAEIYKGITLYGYMARMDGLQKNYLKAFFRINHCLKFLEKSFGAESRYPFFYLSSGLYHYHIVVTAQKYPVLTPYLYLYPKGDQKKGIEFLQIASQHSNKYLNTEGNYFLMKLYLEEKKYELAYTYGNELHQRFPNNAIFTYYLFLIHLNMHHYNLAQETATQLLNSMKNNKECEPQQYQHFEKLIAQDLQKFRH